MAGRSTTSPEEKKRKLAEAHARERAIRDGIKAGVLPPEARFASPAKRARARDARLAANPEPPKPPPETTPTVIPAGGSEFGRWGSKVPSELRANLTLRRRFLYDARSSPDRRAAIKAMCARDLLFWASLFAWVYEPRNVEPKPKVLPFIPWPFQVDCLRELDSVLGREDRIIEKSRDMGATWMCLIVFIHSFLFHPWRSFLLVGHRKDDVAASGNPDTLFWKLHYLVKMQPRFLLGRFNLDSHSRTLHLEHPDTKSVIDGTSTTKDAGRGGRRSAILLDEFAMCEEGWEMATSTQGTTACRFFNSTPGPIGTDAFVGLIRRKKIKTIRLHWTLHPLKNPGMYQDPKGDWRSPVYDIEEARATDLRRFHREWDINYDEASATVFNLDSIDQLIEKHSADPTGRFRLEKQDNEWRLIPEHEGPIKCWVPIINGKPPMNASYVIGADVSTGSGASNSTMSVSDKGTGEKVAEWVCNYVTASNWGRFAAHLGKVFSGKDGEALLVWEANGGTGRNFGDAALEEGCYRLYYRITPLGKLADKPGWFSTPAEKEALLKAYGDDLSSGSFVNRSREALKECKQYLYTGTGKIEHAEEYFARTGGGGYGGHGDMVIADALACMCSRKRVVEPKPNDPMIPPLVIPKRSFASRRPDIFAKAEDDGW